MERTLQAAEPNLRTGSNSGFSVRERIASWFQTVRKRAEERRIRELMGKFFSDNRDIVDDVVSDKQYFMKRL